MFREDGHMNIQKTAPGMNQLDIFCSCNQSNCSEMLILYPYCILSDYFLLHFYWEPHTWKKGRQVFLLTAHIETHTSVLYFRRKTRMMVQVHKDGTIFHGDSCWEQLVSGSGNSRCLRLIREKSLSELPPFRMSPAELEYPLQAARSRSFEYPPMPQDATSGVLMSDQLLLPRTRQLVCGS